MHIVAFPRIFVAASRWTLERHNVFVIDEKEILVPRRDVSIRHSVNVARIVDFSAADERETRAFAVGPWNLVKKNWSSVSTGRNRVGSHDKLPFVPVSLVGNGRGTGISFGTRLPFYRAYPSWFIVITRNELSKGSSARQLLWAPHPSPDSFRANSRSLRGTGDYPLKNSFPRWDGGTGRSARAVTARVPRGMAMIQWILQTQRFLGRPGVGHGSSNVTSLRS